MSSLLVSFSDRFRVDGWLDTESTEKEILRFRDVSDLLGKGSYSLEFAAGGGEVVLVRRHGFGGGDYFLGLTADEFSVDLRRGGWRCKGWRDEYGGYGKCGDCSDTGFEVHVWPSLRRCALQKKRSRFW